MTALIVTGAVLALILLLLLSPAAVELHYRRGEADVFLRYLFLRFDLLKKRPPRKKAEPAPEQEKAPEEPPKKRKANPLKAAWAMLKASRRGLLIVRRHLVFSRVRVAVRVGGGDAHQTALTYARLHTAVRAALDVIGLAFVLKRPRVDIAADFLAPGIDVDVSLRAGIRPLFALMAAASVFRQYLRLPKTFPRPRRGKVKQVM